MQRNDRILRLAATEECSDGTPSAIVTEKIAKQRLEQKGGLAKVILGLVEVNPEGTTFTTITHALFPECHCVPDKGIAWLRTRVFRRIKDLFGDDVQLMTRLRNNGKRKRTKNLVGDNVERLRTVLLKRGVTVWSHEENRRLLELANSVVPPNRYPDYASIAKAFPGKTARQCQEHTNRLRSRERKSLSSSRVG